MEKLAHLHPVIKTGTGRDKLGNHLGYGAAKMVQTCMCIALLILLYIDAQEE